MSEGKVQDSRAARCEAALPGADALGIAWLIRHIALVGIAGVIAGVLVGGAGGRLLMRIAAIAAPDRVIGLQTENGNRVGEITLGGTIGILIFVGILLGGIGAVAYVIAEPWLAWAGRWRGVAFGLLLLTTASTFALNPDNFDFVVLGNQELIVGMFISLFFLYGVLLVWLLGLLDRRLPAVDLNRRERSMAGYLPIASFGILFAALLGANFFIEGVCGCAPAYLSGIFVLGMGAATLLLYVARETTSLGSSCWLTVATAVGYGSLVGALAAGAIRAAADIAEIL